MCNTNIISIIVYTLVQTCLIVTRGFLNLLFDPYFNLRLLLPLFVCTYVVFFPFFLGMLQQLLQIRNIKEAPTSEWLPVLVSMLR